MNKKMKAEPPASGTLAMLGAAGRIAAPGAAPSPLTPATMPRWKQLYSRIPERGNASIPHTPPSTRGKACYALAVCLLLLLAWAPQVCAQCDAQIPPLQLISQVALDQRLIELTFATPLLNPPQIVSKVRVLLPSNYSAGSNYPVLYLLHAMDQDYTEWSTMTYGANTLESMSAGLNVLIVMPDAQNGWYSNSYNGGAYGAPAWETYHICQLIPWVESNYSVRHDRGGRAIGGASMGGFGTMSYAARHPDLFGAAVTFSGAVNNLALSPLSLPGVSNLTPAISKLMVLPDFDRIWGDAAQQEVLWHGSNPGDLADNLRPVQLFFRTGRGVPGGPGPDDNNLELLALEAGVAPLNDTLDWKLSSLNIPHTYCWYLQGAHSGYHWLEGLSMAWPMLNGVFTAPPPPPPVTFNYRTIAPNFSVFGWNFAASRNVTEFLYVADAGSTGLELTGSGSVAITTAPLYAPGSSHALFARASGVTASPSVAIADAQGRLSFTVNLGPSHVLQQYTAEESAVEWFDWNYWEKSRIDIQ